VEDATLLIYPGAPHGLTSTHKEKFNADLLAFLKATSRGQLTGSATVPTSVS
jgi:hypothetical protein